MPGGIASKHAHLTILHLAQRPTILPCDPHRVLALFDKARLIKHQDAIRVAHLLGHEVMIVPPHLCLIPDDITDKALQSTDRAALHLEGHGLDGVAFQLTELPHHRVKEMGPRLTAGKTVVKGGLELPQFLHEPSHIAGDEVKGGNGKAFTADPTGW